MCYYLALKLRLIYEVIKRYTEGVKIVVKGTLLFLLLVLLVIVGGGVYFYFNESQKKGVEVVVETEERVPVALEGCGKLGEDEIDFDEDGVADQLESCRALCYTEDNQWPLIGMVEENEDLLSAECKRPQIYIKLTRSGNKSVPIVSEPIYTYNSGVKDLFVSGSGEKFISVSGISLGAHSGMMVVFRYVDGRFEPVPNKDIKKIEDTDSFCKDEKESFIDLSVGVRIGDRCVDRYSFWTDAGSPVLTDKDGDGEPEVEIWTNDYNKPFDDPNRQHLAAKYVYRNGEFVKN